MSLAARFDIRGASAVPEAGDQVLVDNTVSEFVDELSRSPLQGDELAGDTTIESATREGHFSSEHFRRLAERKVDDILVDYSMNDRQQLMDTRDAVLDELLGYAPLQELLDHPEVSEIMVNGHHQIFVNGVAALNVLAEHLIAKTTFGQWLTAWFAHLGEGLTNPRRWLTPGFPMVPD